MNHIKHKSGKTELQRRVCRKYCIYYPTLKALNAHSAVCNGSVLDEEEDLELDQGDGVTDNDQQHDIAAIPKVIKPLNIFDHLDSIYKVV